MPLYVQHTSHETGFTLLELIIVVAIVGIIAAIGIPVYNSYISTAHVEQAKTAILTLADAEQNYYTTNNAYTDNPAYLGYSALPAPIPSAAQDDYTLSLSVSSNPAGFTISATPVANGPDANNSCGTLSDNNLGVKNSSSGSCW